MAIQFRTFEKNMCNMRVNIKELNHSITITSCNLNRMALADLSGVKVFRFHAVFGKFWQNCVFVPPTELAPKPRRNPGSATA